MSKSLASERSISRMVCGLLLAAVLVIRQLSAAHVSEAATLTADPRVTALEGRLSAQHWPMALFVASADGSYGAAAGTADADTGRALTMDTPVRVASITKTFVAATLLRLWSKGASISMRRSGHSSRQSSTGCYAATASTLVGSQSGIFSAIAPALRATAVTRASGRPCSPIPPGSGRARIRCA